MRFQPLPIAGATLLEIEPAVDERGYFSRLFSKEQFALEGLVADFAQESVAYNRHAGTLRGFHFQAAPFQETKLVTCVRGAAFDVILDYRPDSATYGHWFSVELNQGKWTTIYIPAGCAHAVQALADETELLYRISCPYEPSAAKGYRWDSPDIGVPWPLSDPILSERDRHLPLFERTRP